MQRRVPVGDQGLQGHIPFFLLLKGIRDGLSLEDVGLGPQEEPVGASETGLVMGSRRGSCKEPKAALYKGQARREKKGTQDCKKPAIPRNNKVSSLVEGTARDWIRSFLSRVMPLWAEVIVSPK